jgi:lipoprotein-releasing system permease protein
MNRWEPFEWITATRFLKEGRMQTIFIITGISIGVAVIVFMSVMLTSLQSNFVRRVLTSQPHIQIIPPDEVARSLRPDEAGTSLAATIQRPTQRPRSIDQWQSVTAQLLQRPDITQVSPNLSASALAVRGDASRSISMTGIDPLVYFKIVRLPDFIVLGVMTDGQPRLTSEDIIIGTELAKDLGVTIGDKLNITAATGVVRLLTVSAIFDLGSKAANARSTFVALRTAQILAKLIGGVLAIDVTVNDPYQAEVIAQSITASTGRTADSWIKTNAQFFTAVSAQKISFGLIRSFVGLSVAFGIASVLVVSVIQRSKDIGILRAMGTSQQQILTVFLLQGALLGFIGSLIGSALGTASFWIFHAFFRQPDGTEIFPMEVEPTLFVAAPLLAMVVGVAAAAAPAWRAAKLDPVVAMRG